MRRLCLVCSCLLGTACGDPADDSGTAAGETETSQSTSGSTGGERPGSTGTQDASSGAAPDTTTGAQTGSPDTSTSSGADETQGTSGSDESGGALPRGQWAMTEITYTEGGASETLTMQDRAFCDATLDGGLLQLRYQQQGGYTVWLVNMPETTGVGEHALTQDFSGPYMNINEVSDTWQAYFDPSTAFGTLTLTDADIQPGGVVAGTLTATLTSADGTTTADFESTFYAEL